MTYNSTSFKKGQSGNPAGRKPKTKEQRALEAACRKLTNDALDVIMNIMFAGENERNRLAAAEYILDRGWGKAKQAAQLSGTAEENLNITVNFIDLENNKSNQD